MNLSVISLNSGKFTPLTDVRSDIEKYSSGCRILDNMIPLIYGPVTRRPGTLYIADVEDHDVKSRMIPFIYSATVAYKLEFSDKILNVYYEDTLIEGDIVTPYLEADLFQLQVKQSADVMWIVHPSYAPRKLSRVAVDNFTLAEITFDNGPFIDRNDIEEDDDVTIAVTGYAVTTVVSGAVGAGSFSITMGSAALATAAALLLTENKTFYITGATAGDDNIDGAYTVDTLRATTAVGTTLNVYPTEAILEDPADNGQIMFDDGTVTLTASSAEFVTGTSGHTGSLFKLTHKREKTVTKGSRSSVGIIGEAINVKGTWSFTTHGTFNATVEIQRMEDRTNWETFRSYYSNSDRNIQKSDVEEVDGVQYRIYISDWTSGTCTADLTVDNSTQDSIFRITATASTTSATATAIIAAPEHEATKRWAEGAWSEVRGYPSAITFFAERTVYGFTDKDPQDVWLSHTGRYEDFEAGVNDADSFALTLPTANRGRWLGALETLAAGTSGDEWRIRAPLDEALTPKNWDMKKQTNYGSADIQAMEVNEAIIFIDFVARKIREFTFSDQKQKYVSPDLTALAEDITSGGITSLAVQKNPDSIIWFTIKNSPYLISMTYEREQNVVALANHPLGGSGIAESVCVTPGTDEDIVTLTAQFTINGDTKRFILDMQPRDFGSTTDPTNAFFVDAGVIDTGGDVTVEVAHLEGEELAILADGAVQASKTVSGGIITIDEVGDRVVAGLPFTYQVSPMRLDVNTQTGTTLGSIKNISKVVFSFFATGNAQYGDDEDTYDIDWRTEEDLGSPPDLFTGFKEVAFDGGFTTDDTIIISGSDPLPCTVRAIVASID